MAVAPDRCRPDPDAHAFPLGDELVVYSATRQELHVLNTSAAVIWYLLADGGDEQAIAASLHDEFAVPPAEAARFAAAALADWRARGLLAGSSPAAPSPAQPTSPTQPASPCPGLRRGSEGLITATRSFALLQSGFQLRFTSPEQAAIVEPLLAHLQADIATPDAVFDIVPAGSGVAVLRDGQACAWCDRIDELAPLVKNLIWTTAVNAGTFLVGIHAGVVGGERGALLLPGRSGSGKTSLTAALVHAGFDYLSDEMALLRDGDLAVLPLPLALCVKDTGMEALASRFPALLNCRVHNRADGKRVAYMPVPGAAGSARPVRAVLFPTYGAGAATAFRPLPAGPALRRLLAECLVVRQQLNVERVRLLLDWIGRVPCFELTFGALDEAVAVATGILLGTE